MKPRRLAVTPQAQRDFTAIITWYRRELGALSAAKAARSIQAGIRAAARIDLNRARREDLPEGYFRIVARTHDLQGRERHCQDRSHSPRRA